jgi:hypothetical protein
MLRTAKIRGAEMSKGLSLAAGAAWAGEDAKAELAELYAEIQGLQRALSFWHPGVPATGPNSIYDRAAHDAFLLIGFDGPNEQSARELGWITLSNTLETATEPCQTCGKPLPPISEWSTPHCPACTDAHYRSRNPGEVGKCNLCSASYYRAEELGTQCDVQYCSGTISPTLNRGTKS